MFYVMMATNFRRKSCQFIRVDTCIRLMDFNSSGMNNWAVRTFHRFWLNQCLNVALKDVVGNLKI